MTTKRHRDYITCSIPGAKWVTSTFAKGRRLAFYGIGAALSLNPKTGKIELCPEISCAGPLVKLVKAHPDESSFRFDMTKRKWSVAR